MSVVLEVQVSAARMLSPVVREFTLQSCAGPLPGFSPGSHVQVHLPLAAGKVRNAYSLTGDPAHSHHYRIAVRLQDVSRGGSHYLHRQVRVGDRLQISPPANLFALHSTASLHILIAGGIGITPFMAYIAALEQRQAHFELHYLYRRGLSDAYVDELQQRLGSRLHTYASRPDLGRILRDRPLRVGAEQSLLVALESAGLQIPNLCRGGVCGQCMTRHRGGDIEHRDNFLSPAEQDGFLMPCVSRGRGQCVSLDL